MDEFVIFDFTRRHELATIQAESASSALDWFLSTLESYERDEALPVMAVITQHTQSLAGVRLA